MNEARFLDKTGSEVGVVTDFQCSVEAGSSVRSFRGNTTLGSLIAIHNMETGQLLLKFNGRVYGDAKVDLPAGKISGSSEMIVQIEGRFG